MKILVTPRSFAKTDPAPMELLKACAEVVPNATGNIMNEQELRVAISGCDGVVIGVDPLTAEVMRAAPGLRAVAKYGVGLDNIDLDYCRAQGIAVSRTVGSNSDAVADYAFALLMALARKVTSIDQACRAGSWKKITTADVSGKTLGVLGMGAIGKGMVQRAAGFHMKVMAYDPRWDEDFARSHGVERADIDDLCRRCDFLSIHVPLTDATRGLIDARRLGLMKPTAYLINTARGGLVNESALLEVLKAGRLAGAGIDTFDTEPPADPAWFRQENVVLGSHCAASTQGASEQMSRMAAENLLRDLGLRLEGNSTKDGQP